MGVAPVAHLLEGELLGRGVLGDGLDSIVEPSQFDQNGHLALDGVLVARTDLQDCEGGKRLGADGDTQMGAWITH